MYNFDKVVKNVSDFGDVFFVIKINFQISKSKNEKKS